MLSSSSSPGGGTLANSSASDTSGSAGPAAWAALGAAGAGTSTASSSAVAPLADGTSGAGASTASSSAVGVLANSSSSDGPPDTTSLTTGSVGPITTTGWVGPVTTSGAPPLPAKSAVATNALRSPTGCGWIPVAFENSATAFRPVRQIKATPLTMPAHLTASSGDSELDTIGTINIVRLNANTRTPSPVRMNFVSGDVFSGMTPICVLLTGVDCTARAAPRRAVRRLALRISAPTGPHRSICPNEYVALYR